jgi:hypothetical protein
MPTQAQEGKSEAKPAQAQQDKSDKSGTNPINFSHDIRFYNEFTRLTAPGEGRQNVTTLEYRQPFADGKWQFRTRIRFSGIELDTNDDGVDEVDEWGLGDVDFRFLTVPYIDMSKGHALAVGLETFLPTATTHGPERLAFGPQVFYVKFRPFGLKGFLLAPGYQHKFSTWEEPEFDVLHQGLINLFVLWKSESKQYWALLDPQIVIDYEEDKVFNVTDLELGMMLDKFTGSKGHSTYLRPSVGIGSDRPSDYSIEVGYKVVW